MTNNKKKIKFVSRTEKLQIKKRRIRALKAGLLTICFFISVILLCINIAVNFIIQDYKNQIADACYEAEKYGDINTLPTEVQEVKKNLLEDAKETTVYFNNKISRIKNSDILYISYIASHPNASFVLSIVMVIYILLFVTANYSSNRRN